MVGSEDTGTTDDQNTSSSMDHCSICLDLVTDNGERSRAKLLCGHEFHLDCIGSAFNTKGAMQCPNCRKVEGGRWLYANSSTSSFPHISMVDWTVEEYELSYSGMPFRVRWCPFNRLPRVQASFEEVESPLTTYHDLQGHHPIFSENTSSSSGAHSYLAYVGPISHAATNSNENVDDPNHSNRWNGLSRHHEIFAPHGFPAIDNAYQSGARRSPPISVNGNPINRVDQAQAPPSTLRSSRESDTVTRSGPFLHPFLYAGYGYVPRGGTSFFSPTVHPVNHSRSHEMIQVPRTIHHHQQPGNPTGILCPVIPGVRRFNGSRGLPSVIPVPAQSDHNGNFLLFPPSSSSSRDPHETENPALNHFHTWERDHLDTGRGSFPHPTGGSDSGNRTGSFWQRHWS